MGAVKSNRFITILRSRYIWRTIIAVQLVIKDPLLVVELLKIAGLCHQNVEEHLVGKHVSAKVYELSAGLLEVCTGPKIAHLLVDDTQEDEATERSRLSR